jgi:hypothetical protein
MDACPDGFFIGEVKNFDCLDLEPRLNNKNRFNWTGKIELFQRSHHDVGIFPEKV